MTALADVSTTPTAFDTKIVIYLEGEDDVEVFKVRWFADETNLEFLFVGGTQNQGGCQRVIDVVNGNAQVITTPAHGLDAFDPQNLQDSAPKFGLVDRDTLFFRKPRHEEVFFEADDDEFYRKYAAVQPFGSNVRTLRRWEMENYLIAHARIVSMALQDHPGRDSPYASYNEEKMADALLGHAHTLIPVVAANLALHAHEKGALDDNDKFGVNQRDRQGMEAAIDDRLASEFANDNSLRGDIDTHVAAIEQFDDVSHPSAARWERLSRIIDGKRMLARLSNRLKEAKDFRLMLARYIKQEGLIDPEFRDHIAYFRRLAAQGSGATGASVA